MKLSRALQETLLAAVASADAELPQSFEEQSPVRRDLPQNAFLQSTKRPLDATFDVDPWPAKRARLTRTDEQQPGAWNKKPEQAVETTLQQPKPRPSARSYASFLKDFVDPVHLSRPGSLDSFVLEWLESVESDREKRCRSDSHLYYSDDPISRQLARSAPEIFIVPPKPASASFRSNESPGSFGRSNTSDRSSARNLVEDPNYRDLNLADNNIYMRPPYEDFPKEVADLVDLIRKERDSPEPSPDEIMKDSNLAALQWTGAWESEVKRYFSTNIFPQPHATDSIQISHRLPMTKHVVPNTGIRFRVSNPVPDMLYGYSHIGAFPQHQSQLISLGTEPMANNAGLMYPFFVVEFKGDGSAGSGSLWVATNQCLGGSSSCIKTVERLNQQLQQYKGDAARTINSAAFSIAMNGTEARLHISWKHDELAYYMANVKSFLLQRPSDYLEFRKCVRNIIDWGKDKRLNEIKDSLDAILRESSV